MRRLDERCVLSDVVKMQFTGASRSSPTLTPPRLPGQEVSDSEKRGASYAEPKTTHRGGRNLGHAGPAGLRGRR